VFTLFLLSGPVAPSDLPSFPTRRSSDLFLHLGNLLGALDNWKALQEKYECFFFVADWHAISTNYADTSRIKEFTRELLIDWLARSEEHTSELQSRSDLVCRLLLEKKNTD